MGKTDRLAANWTMSFALTRSNCDSEISLLRHLYEVGGVFRFSVPEVFAPSRKTQRDFGTTTAPYSPGTTSFDRLTIIQDAPFELSIRSKLLQKIANVSLTGVSMLAMILCVKESLVMDKCKLRVVTRAKPLQSAEAAETDEELFCSSLNAASLLVSVKYLRIGHLPQICAGAL